MEVIRPAGRANAADRRLEVGRGTASMTWTAPGIALDVTGPATGSIGSQASFQVVVTNNGDMPLNDVVVSDRVPAPLEFINSNIAASEQSGLLRWNMGQLAAGHARGHAGERAAAQDRVAADVAQHHAGAGAQGTGPAGGRIRAHGGRCRSTGGQAGPLSFAPCR